MNIGDKLVCHRMCIMEGTCDITTTVGKLYIILDIRNSDATGKMCLEIIDDNNDEHLFPIDNYKYYFYNIQELRKNKLMKINEI